MAVVVAALCHSPACGQSDDVTSVDIPTTDADHAVDAAHEEPHGSGNAAPVANSSLSVPGAGKACVFDPVSVSWSSNEVLADGTTAGGAGFGAWIGLFHATRASRQSVCLHQSPFAVLGLGDVERSDQSGEAADFAGQGASVVGAAAAGSGGAGAGPRGAALAPAQDVAGVAPTQRLRCLLDPLFCDVSLKAMRVFYVVLDNEEAGGDAAGEDEGSVDGAGEDGDADGGVPTIVATRQLQVTGDGKFATPEGYADPAADGSEGESESDDNADAVVDVRGSVDAIDESEEEEQAGANRGGDRLRLVSAHRDHPMFYSLLTFGQDTNQCVGVVYLRLTRAWLVHSRVCALGRLAGRR